MPVSPFVVHVARMRRVMGSRINQFCQGPMEDLACSGSSVPEGADVEAEVTLEAVSGGISVVGAVRAPWVGTCRRCLAPASGTLNIPVREIYTAGGDGEDTYPLEDDTVDLAPLVHDAVLLELPQVPLCKSDCKGLCPHCGSNLEEGDCGCTVPTDYRWAALDVLKVRDDDGSEN